MVDFQDEDFSDDDLDKLPQDTLIELENKAIQYTQAQTQARLNAVFTSDYGDDLEDDDLKDAVVIDGSSSTQVIIPSLHVNITKTTELQKDVGVKISQISPGKEPNLSLRTNTHLFKTQTSASQNDSLSQLKENKSLITPAQITNLQRQVEEVL